ncbi:helix-turn-helix transcriptional regulator [Klebsiella aerogenes]|uniref:helix-turn-helix domain-containing protein n=1 Tax=Klebsiella aerogenes TaxID=548 RepID=UPI0018AB5D7D|nr:helix-turn-helix transcriptional regulator [Klebsiella aerogenes]MBF8484820.1 helix-turn-helix transcriptional regulator [Klebsiella aerogenes]
MKKSNVSVHTFSKRLKEIRLSKGLSQKQLGILAGIDEFVASTRINRYEKGVHQPSLDVAQQLAKVLDVPLAYLYTEDDLLARLVVVWDTLEPVKKEYIQSIAFY